jgi:ABC-type multidrug transport system fused ATPase/permease subunit
VGSVISLLKIAFSNHRRLLLFTLISILLVTLSSKLEMFALGVITNKQAGGEGTKVGTLLQLIQPYFPIDQNMMTLATFLLTIAFLHAFSLFFHRYVTRIVAIHVGVDLRQRYFDHLQKLPFSFFQKNNIGALSTRVVGDSSLIAEAVTSSLSNYFQTPLVVISSLALCFYTSWQLSLIVFIGFPAIIFPVVYLTKKVRRISRQLQENKERFSSDLIDFLSGIQTVKMFAMESFSRKKFAEQNEKMAALEKKSSKYDLACRPVVHTIAMSFLSISLLWGLYGLKLSIPDTLFFCGLLYIFYEPVKKFAEENSRIQRGLAAADRLFEILKIPPFQENSEGLVPLATFKDSIEFDNVSFKYEERNVLNNLSFKIKKGEMVAIVGPTGAGKSTIVNLLPRLWDVDQGQIRIDGRSIKDYTIASLREAIAFVPQKPFLFYDTVANNICFGREFSKEKIQKAAIEAHAHEFIQELPHKYQTLLAEGGKSLSGGQQQRLAIARALIKGSPILIMDEATSSLDAVSEQLVKRATEELRGKVTQIIIAHRLSTIEDADRIIYLDQGKKLAEGTKEQLLSSCPPFRKMWESFTKEKVGAL